jgi:hypothetical protein
MTHVSDYVGGCGGTELSTVVNVVSTEAGQQHVSHVLSHRRWWEGVAGLSCQLVNVVRRDTDLNSELL